MDGYTVISGVCSGLASLLTTFLQALFLGCSCGCCGMCECVNRRCNTAISLLSSRLRQKRLDLRNYHSQFFRISFAQGYFVLSIFFVSIEMGLGMYRFYDGYEYEILILSQFFVFLVSLLGLACIWCSQKQWSLLLMVQGWLVVIKFSYTVYLVLNHVIQYDMSVTSSYEIFLCFATFLDALLITLWTLWPVLSIKLSQERNAADGSKSSFVQSVPFAAWAFEVSDMVSILLVCIVYAGDVKENQDTNSVFNNNDWTMPLYFILFLSNLFFYCFPLYFLFLCPNFCQSCQHEWLLGAHVFFLDVITDGPLLTLTFAARTYEGNEYIICDVFWKMYLFLRALLICGTANKANDAIVDQECINWHFNLDEAYNALPVDEGEPLLVGHGRVQNVIAGAVQAQAAQTDDAQDAQDALDAKDAQDAESQQSAAVKQKCAWRWCCMSLFFFLIVCLFSVSGYFYAKELSSPNYPTESPTRPPSLWPTSLPTHVTLSPSVVPTAHPTIGPTGVPTEPTTEPSIIPTAGPTQLPSHRTRQPSTVPTSGPTKLPTHQTSEPSLFPTTGPTELPTTSTVEPTAFPTRAPTKTPHKNGNERDYKVSSIWFLWNLYLVCIILEHA